LSSKPRFFLAQAGLLLLCAIWIVPGLIGHAPWKGGDGDHFVTLWLWLQRGVPLGDTPPLYFWTAAATAWLTSPVLALADGARLASGVFVALALWFTARTAQALYGTEHRWAAALVLMGSVGLLVRGHELNAYTAQFAAAAIMLDGVARLPQGRHGGGLLALGAALLLLAGAAAEAALFLVLAVALAAMVAAHRTPLARRALAWGLAGALAFAVVWSTWLTVRQAALPTALGLDRWIGFANLRPLYYPGILGWFAWPAWPLAVWALYRGRRQWRTAAIALPVLAFAGLLLLYAFAAHPGEERGLVLLLPLSLLGAAGVLTLRRGAANALLWFAVMLFGFIALLFWTYWSAHDLGMPARLARRLIRFGVPDVGTLRPWAPVLGALLTLAWIAFLARIQRSPLRPALVWATGMTFIWTLLLALFLAPLDRRLSYVSVAEELAARVPPGACIQTHAMRSTQRLLLAYHSGRTLAPADLDCGWLLLETRSRGAAPHVPDTWVKQWEGARPGDRADRFHLYVRH